MSYEKGIPDLTNFMVNFQESDSMCNCYVRNSFSQYWSKITLLIFDHVIFVFLNWLYLVIHCLTLITDLLLLNLELVL